MQNRYPMLSKTDAAWLDETMSRTHSRFGGWRMEEAAGQTGQGQHGNGSTGQQTAQTGGQQAQQQPGDGKQPPWGKPEDFDAEKAWELIQNLRKEKGEDPAVAELTKQLDEMKKSSETQRDALAKALGIKPEETSDTDKFAQQLKTLQEQITASQHKATLLELAANPGEDSEGNALPAIPKEYHHLLTATETEALQAQAKSVAALVAARQSGTGTPGFASPAGQGQGNNGKGPALAEQVAAAEKEAAGKTVGSAEHKAAQQRVMALKSQQLAATKSQ